VTVDSMELTPVLLNIRKLSRQVLFHMYGNIVPKFSKVQGGDLVRGGMLASLELLR